MITLEEFETEIAKWKMKFDSVRDWRAERARLPLMRQHYESILAETGLPPNLQSFADSFWQACLIVESHPISKQELKHVLNVPCLRLLRNTLESTLESSFPRYGSS